MTEQKKKYKQNFYVAKIKYKLEIKLNSYKGVPKCSTGRPVSIGT